MAASHNYGAQQAERFVRLAVFPPSMLCVGKDVLHSSPRASNMPFYQGPLPRNPVLPAAAYFVRRCFAAPLPLYPQMMPARASCHARLFPLARRAAGRVLILWKPSPGSLRRAGLVVNLWSSLSDIREVQRLAAASGRDHDCLRGTYRTTQLPAGTETAFGSTNESAHIAKSGLIDITGASSRHQPV